jgi:membrane-associated phospholipid phosphatase
VYNINHTSVNLWRLNRIMENLQQFEIAITLFLQSLGSWLGVVMKAFTYLGEEEAFLLLMPALYWCLSAVIGLRVAAMLLLSNIVNTFFKLLLHSPRPYWVDTRVKAYLSESSFGLPSGHAQHAASVWGMLAYNLRRRWVTIVLVTVIFMIGLSRIVLGVHFTTDVIAGWSIGALLLIGVLAAEKPVLAWFRNLAPTTQIVSLFISSLALLGIALLPLAISPGYQVPGLWITNASLAFPDKAINPLDPSGAFTVAGTWFGMTAGAAWLFAFRGGLNPSGPISKRILRYVVGIVGVVALYMGLGAIFPREADLISYSLRFARYALIGLWVSLFGPLLFVTLKLMDPVPIKTSRKRRKRDIISPAKHTE